MDGTNMSSIDNSKGLGDDNEGSFSQLYDYLQHIIKRETAENEDIAVGLNSQQFLRLWEKFCVTHKIETNGGIYNEKIALQLLQKILDTQEGKNKTDTTKTQIKDLVNNLITHRNIQENTAIICTQDFQSYIRTGKSNTKYPPEGVIQYINSDNLGSIHETVILNLISQKVGMDHIIQSITSRNISKIQGGNGRILMKIILAGRVLEIINFINSENIEYIDWSFFQKLKDNNDTQNLKKLLLLVSEQNSSQIHVSILSILGYEGAWGGFVRSFLGPVEQARWRKIEKKTRNFRKLIRNFFTQED